MNIYGGPSYEPPKQAQEFALKLLQMLGHQVDMSGWTARKLIIAGNVETHWGVYCNVRNCKHLFVLSGTSTLLGRHSLTFVLNPPTTFFYVMNFHINSTRNPDDYVRIIKNNEDYERAQQYYTCVRYSNLR